jgi:hypothetical protein
LKARAEHAYKVRFNDGTEAMLRRTEFSILNEFKGILGNDERADVAFLSEDRAEVVEAEGDATVWGAPCRRARLFPHAEQMLVAADEQAVVGGWHR